MAEAGLGQFPKFEGNFTPLATPGPGMLLLGGASPGHHFKLARKCQGIPPPIKDTVIPLRKKHPYFTEGVSRFLNRRVVFWSSPNETLSRFLQSPTNSYRVWCSQKLTKNVPKYNPKRPKIWPNTSQNISQNVPQYDPKRPNI